MADELMTTEEKRRERTGIVRLVTRKQQDFISKDHFPLSGAKGFNR